MDTPANFDRDAAERVLRRAIELAEETEPQVDGVSERALVEAADELGVDPTVVRRAASEERLGLLATPRPLLDRMAGPATVTATRVVSMPARNGMDQVDTWLRRNGTFRRRRMDDDRLIAEYVRRTDAVAGAQRAVRSIMGNERLDRVRRLRLLGHQVESDRSVVALVADLHFERATTLAGGGSIAGIGSAASAVVAAGGAWGLWLGVPASVAAGLAMMRVRANGVDHVEVELMGVLDRVAAGDAGGGLADVRDRLRSGFGRNDPSR